MKVENNHSGSLTLEISGGTKLEADQARGHDMRTRTRIRIRIRIAIRIAIRTPSAAAAAAEQLTHSRSTALRASNPDMIALSRRLPPLSAHR